MEYANLAVEQRGRILSVTIDRPDRMNAIDQATCDELLHVLERYRDDAELWVMIITGAGERAFCSGVDVDQVADKTAKATENKGYDSFKPWIDVMQSIHKPFVCAVNGFCVGGGWHFVADSDVIIASDNAQFLDTHVNIGLVNGVESAGMAWKMPRGIVSRMVIEGRKFRVNAEQAYQWGLVSEVVPLAELSERAWEIATNIAEECAPLAVASSKRAMLEALDLGPTAGIARAWEILHDIKESDDTREGTKAFAERRKPRFTGS